MCLEQPFLGDAENLRTRLSVSMQPMNTCQPANFGLLFYLEGGLVVCSLGWMSLDLPNRIFQRSSKGLVEAQLLQGRFSVALMTITVWAVWPTDAERSQCLLSFFKAHLLPFSNLCTSSVLSISSTYFLLPTLSFLFSQIQISFWALAMVLLLTSLTFLILKLFWGELEVLLLYDFCVYFSQLTTSSELNWVILIILLLQAMASYRIYILLLIFYLCAGLAFSFLEDLRYIDFWQIMFSRVSLSIASQDFIWAYIIILNLEILLNDLLSQQVLWEGRAEVMRKVWALFGQQQQMILQPEHKHQQSSPEPQAIVPISIEPPSPARTDHLPKPPAILSQILAQSSQFLNEKSRDQIKDMVKYSEQKIQLIFSEQPNTYLQHLSSKNDNNDTQVLLKEIIGLENDLFVDRIVSGGQRVYERPNFKDLNSSLTNKITDMKRSIMSLSSIDRKASKQFQNFMEFRKKSYWNVPSEKNQQLKSFLSKMKRVYSQHRKNYRKAYKETETRTLKEIQQQIKQKQVHKKELHVKELEKQTQWRKDRQKYNEQEKKKRQEIQNLLKKFNPDQRIYKRKQQEFVKNFIEPLQEQRQKKLDERKERYQPLDHQELEEHLHKYQEYKETLIEEHNKKKEEDREINTKLEQELKELYHGKFHQDIQPRFYNSVKVEREGIRKRIKEYGTEIKEKHKPNVDPQKRSELKESIRDLELSMNKRKRKTMREDGTVVIEDIPDIDPRRLGVQYLQKLRQDNQGKPRKKEDRSASMLQLQNKLKYKKIDYLRQNKPNVKLKQSMGDWKKVIDDSSYSPRQKYASIMQKVNVMQQKARQKQSQVRSYKKGQKSLQLKEEMDRFYMQSVAAKMVILKDVILKQ